MTSLRRTLPSLVLFAGLLSGTPLHGQQSRTEDILGRWEGTSICIKAEWNAACNDESIVYFFEPSTAHPGQVRLHAEKLVNGAPAPMYDLEFVFDSAAHQWSGYFANARVSIRWSYQLRGDDLTGTVVDLKTGRTGRNVAARRSRPSGR